ncbi:hypothetical protein [Streptomyces sp. NBC_01443]|uniref:hypothetical protein n=1 Tax=Streptomyces sp. NBC_01443 TaxID=2903868 RepID=UPI0022568E61|nr:hypothetical protein [Streptomyces sp. NBC_01443]MCX4632353.1 hypothetical protein [Streptomyces sp. NBC_01443]
MRPPSRKRPGFELAPDHVQGAYQSVFALGPGITRALGPSLLAVVVLRNGVGGWLALAVSFVVSGAVVSAAARWAIGDRAKFTATVAAPGSAAVVPATAAAVRPTVVDS